MRARRALGFAAAALAGAFAACDLPFAPRWDAGMYLPLSTKSIYLNNVFTFGFIPPNTSDTASFPPQQQSVTGAVADVLKNLVTDPARAQTFLTLTVAKRTAVSANDTLFVASDSSGLKPNARDTTIVFPISLATTDTVKSDSLVLSIPQITMLQNTTGVLFLSVGSHALWIQLRGRVSNPSTSPVTITQADSLTIRLTVNARVAVSHR